MLPIWAFLAGVLVGMAAVIVGLVAGVRLSRTPTAPDLVAGISSRKLEEAPRGEVAQATAPLEDPLYSSATLDRGAEVLMREALLAGERMSFEEARAHAEELLSELGGR